MSYIECYPDKRILCPTREHANSLHPLVTYYHSGIIPDSRVMRGDVEKTVFRRTAACSLYCIEHNCDRNNLNKTKATIYLNISQYCKIIKYLNNNVCIFIIQCVIM